MIRRDSLADEAEGTSAPRLKKVQHIMDQLESPEAGELRHRVRAHYDQVAETWREKVWVTDSEVGEAIRAFFRLPAGGRTLDVGTGAGDLISLLPSTCSPVGLDISRAILAECRKRMKDVALVQADAAILPFASESFAAVTSRNLLQCFYDPLVPLREMFRVAEHFAWIFIVESAVHDDERNMPTAVCKVVEPWHPLFPSHEDLRRLLAECGAVEIQQEVLGIRRRWLSRWQSSKQATDRQRETIYRVCENYPDWYKNRYEFTFYPEECEIESVLTFSLLRGRKANPDDPVCRSPSL